MNFRIIMILAVFVLSALLSMISSDAATGPQQKYDKILNVPAKQVNGALPEGVSADWWEAAQHEIRSSEYKVTWQEQTYLPDIKASFQAPNRAHNLRTYFTPTGIRIIPRIKSTPSWQWGVTLTGYGYDSDVKPVEAAHLEVSGNRVEYRRGKITEWYVNDEKGLEQGFDLKSPPESGVSPSGFSVVLKLAFSGNLSHRLHRSGDVVDFRTSDGQNTIHYGKLHVIDASGKTLPAEIRVNDRELSLLMDTKDARYPITIDPIIWGGSSEPDWTYLGPYGSMEAQVGHSVATAGDVNGDGYSDVIVGACFWDAGEADEGRVFVFYGSATGLSTDVFWSAESNQESAHFGSSVGTAGDVNGDGFADIIVGAPSYENGQDYEGAAFVFHGFATGLGPDGTPSNADWSAEGNLANVNFGNAVSTAGDVNGDGFADVIVGSWVYDNGHLNEGAVFVYHGSPTGLSTTPWFAESDNYRARFGVSVATAGDVNADGYADIVVGAEDYTNGETDEGAAFVFHGSSTGLDSEGTRPSGNPGNSDWSAEGDVINSSFGNAVSTAGDVNGDGYADVVIGADNYTVYGRAFVYYGSPTGLNSTDQWYAEGDVAGGGFGSSVATAGDANGDGYADIIVGADGYDNDQTNEGAAFVYLGSSTGLDLNGTRLSGNPGNADWMDEGDQDEARLGWSVATAGDVNGDGYAEVIVGTPSLDIGTVPPKLGVDTGRAAVYHGSANGLSTTAGWTDNFGDVRSVGTAGDVNGDGYADVIVGEPHYDGGEGNEGAAFVYYGSATGLSTSADWMAESNFESADFGWSAATAGDVNGDGFADVIVGAPEYYPNQATDWGAAFVYHGSATGLGPDGTPDNADWLVISRLYTTSDYGGHFGYSAATAGDVNGDGYADVIIGAPDIDQGVNYRSHVTVFHGSAGGLSTVGDRIDMYADDEIGFGESVGTAGDVNGDGYSDVIVGASRYGDWYLEGAAFVYHGSPTGLSTSVSWSAESDSSVRFGYSVSTAGDVNGDGYADIIVGAENYDNGETREGAAFVYHGSPSGLKIFNGTRPLGNLGNSDWIAEGNKLEAVFGSSVGTAGDVNGDGYADVIVGAPFYYKEGPYQPNAGAAFVFHGSAGGLSTSPDWTGEGNQADARFGQCVGTAGDVNGDGYADIIVGTFYRGSWAYYGNGGGLSLSPRQRKSDDSGPIAYMGMSDSEDAFSLSMLGRTPYGRGKVKLQWEVKPLGMLFDGTGTQESTAWTDIGSAGAEINELVEGLSAGSLYHWRMRLHYHPATTPFQQYSRWLTMPWNGWQEADLRTVPVCDGDFDEDGDIDGMDLETMIGAYNTGDLIADFNNDGSVDELDLLIFAQNFGNEFCSYIP